MSKKSVLKMSALAVAFAAAAAPLTAAAEVTGSLGISNFYLWRGQDLTLGGGVVHGSLDYGHESGFYAGVWGSSETTSGIGGETDVYFGYAGEAGDLSYDVAYYSYIYPAADQGIFEAGEVYVGLGLADFSLGIYLSLGDDAAGDLAFADDKYITLGYSYDKFGFLLGTTLLDAADTDYTHFDVSYAPIENLTFTVSKVIASDDLAGVTDDQDFLFNVGYSFSF